jgi:adenylate kinase family enzyme
MSLGNLQGRRIVIIGNSGSGKSTLARALAARLKVKHVELDALNWGPGWTALSQRDPERFARVVAADGWVSDGNYSRGALPSILPRATDVVWLEYSRAVIMARVTRRSFMGALSGRELWPGTGNREDFRQWLDKEHPIRWTWDTYRSANARRAVILADPAMAHARMHQLKSSRRLRKRNAGWSGSGISAAL